MRILPKSDAPLVTDERDVELAVQTAIGGLEEHGYELIDQTQKTVMLHGIDHAGVMHTILILKGADGGWTAERREGWL